MGVYRAGGWTSQWSISFSPTQNVCTVEVRERERDVSMCV